jgi:flagellar assembly protein FliH
MRDNAVTVDIGDAFEAPSTPVTMNTTIRGGFGGDRRSPSHAEMLDNVRDEAELIILKARNEAQVIVEHAEQETEKQLADTLEKARSQGYEEGYGKGASEGESIKREAEALLDDAQSERERILRDIEPQAVELIVKILNKLMGVYVQVNPQIILKLVREGLAGIVGTEGVKLHVSPEDFDFVREHFDQIKEFAGSNSVDLARDAALGPMGCVIETAFGNIDSSLDQQFEALKGDLYATLRSIT